MNQQAKVLLSLQGENKSALSAMKAVSVSLSDNNALIIKNSGIVKENTKQVAAHIRELERLVQIKTKLLGLNKELNSTGKPEEKLFNPKTLEQYTKNIENLTAKITSLNAVNKPINTGKFTMSGDLPTFSKQIDELAKNITKYNKASSSVVTPKIDINKVNDVIKKVELLGETFSKLKDKSKVEIKVSDLDELRKLATELKSITSILNTKNNSNNINEERAAKRAALEQERAMKKIIAQEELDAQKRINDLVKLGSKFTSGNTKDYLGIDLIDYNTKLSAVIKQFEKLRDLGRSSGVEVKGLENLEAKINVLKKLQDKMEGLKSETSKVKDALNDNKKETFLTHVGYDALSLEKKFLAIGVVAQLLAESIKKVFQEIKEAIASAINEALKFEQRVYQMRTVTANEMGDFQETARGVIQAAREVAANAKDAAGGIQTVYAAGVKTAEEAVIGYHSALMASRATQSDFNDLIKAGIIINNNYGTSVKNWDTLFNKLSIAAKRSKADVSDFAKQIPSLVSAFAPAGIALDDTLALFSAFNNSLRNSSEASVAAVNFLSKIQKPSKEVKGIIAEINKNTKGIGDNIVFSGSAIGGDLEGFLNNLKLKITAFAKDKRMNVGDIVSNLFKELRASKGATQALKAIFTGTFGDIKKHIQNDTKDLQAAYEESIQSILDKWDMFSNQIGNAWKSLFVTIQPTLQELLGWIDGALNTLIGFIDDLAGEFAYLKDAGLFVVEMFKAMGTVFGFLVKNIFYFIGDIIKIFASLVNIVIKSVDIVFTEIMVLGKTIAQIPQFWRDIKAGNLGAIKDFFDSQIQIVAEKGQNLRDEFSRLWGRLKDNAQGREFELGGSFKTDRNYTGSNKKPGEASKENYDPIKDMDEFGKNQIDYAMTAEKFEEELEKLRDEAAKNRVEATKSLSDDLKYETNKISKEYSDRIALLKERLDDEIAVLDSYNRQKKEMEKANNIDSKTAEKFAKDKDPKMAYLPNNMNSDDKKKYLNLVLKARYTAENIAEIEKTNADASAVYLEDRDAKLAKARKENSDKVKAQIEADNREYKQAVDKQYNAKIDKLETELKEVQENGEAQGLSKAQILKKSNAILEKIAKEYQSKAAKFSAGQENNTEAIKQSTEIYRKIQQNKTQIFKDESDNRINQLKTELSEFQAEAEEEGLSKAQALTKANEKLLQIAREYRKRAAGFGKGSKDNTESIKEAQAYETKIAKNNTAIFKEGLKDRLQAQDESYERQKNKLQEKAELEKLTEDEQLNNEIALNKWRMGILSKDLASKKLSFEQEKKYTKELEDIKTDSVLKLQKIKDIQFQRDQDNAEAQIQLELDLANILVNIGKESQQKLLDFEIQANNRRIEQAQKRIDNAKNPDDKKKAETEMLSLINNGKQLDFNKERYPVEKELDDLEYLNQQIKEKYSNRKILIESYYQDLKTNLEKQLSIHENDVIAFKDSEEKKTEALRNAEEVRKQLNQLSLEYEEGILQRKQEISNNIIAALDAVDVCFSKVDKSSPGIKSIFETFQGMISAGKEASGLFNRLSTIDSNISSINKQRNDVKNSSTLSVPEKKQQLDALNKQLDTTKFNTALVAVEGIAQFAASAASSMSKWVDLLGKSNKSAGEVLETQQAVLANIPIVGQALAGLMGLFNQLIGADKIIEYDKNIKEILFERAQIEASLGKETTKKKIDLIKAELEYNKNKLNDQFKDERIIKEKTINLEIQAQDKINKIQEEAAQKSLQIDLDLLNSRLDMIDTFESRLEKFNFDTFLKNNDILLKVLSKELTPDQGKKMMETNNNILNKNINKESADNAKEQITLNAKLTKSMLELKEESYKTSIDIAYAEFDEKKAILDAELEFKQIKQDKYDKELIIAKNDLSKKLKDIEDKSSKDIQAINQKQYNLEKDLLLKKSNEKINFLKSEIDKEIELIENKDKKIREIEEGRVIDEEAIKKRKAAFDNAVSSTKLSASVLIKNEDDFNSGGDGNEDLRKKAIKDYELNGMSFEEYSKQRAQLGLEKYLYYINAASKATKIEDIEALSQKAEEGQREYYDFVFDKDKEKIETDARIAAKKLEVNKAELKKEEEAQISLIKSLDSHYLDSAGNMKKNYVEKFRDWISIAKGDIAELGVDLYNSINNALPEFAQSKKDAEKATGKTYSESTNTYTPDQKNNIQNNIRAGETPEQAANRINAEDAATQRAKLAGTSSYQNLPGNPVILNPGGYSTGGFVGPLLPSASSSDVKNNIQANQSAGMSIDDTIARIRLQDTNAQRARLGLPPLALHAKGGPSIPGYVNIFGEAGTEVAFTGKDFTAMYEWMKTAIHSNNPNKANYSSYEPTLNFNPQVNIYGVPTNDANEIQTVVKAEFKNLWNEIRKK